jgi:hypothetical protein
MVAPNNQFHCPGWEIGEGVVDPAIKSVDGTS